MSSLSPLVFHIQNDHQSHKNVLQQTFLLFYGMISILFLYTFFVYRLCIPLFFFQNRLFSNIKITDNCLQLDNFIDVAIYHCNKVFVQKNEFQFFHSILIFL
jgi:hypothetical protein